MVDKELILRISVCLPEVGVDFERIAAMLGYKLTDYSDGRYPFNVEMFKNGLHQCLMAAIHDAVAEREDKLHRGETVPHYDEQGRKNGATSKSVITTEAAMKGVYAYTNGEMGVEIV